MDQFLAKHPVRIQPVQQETQYHTVQQQGYGERARVWVACARFPLHAGDTFKHVRCDIRRQPVREKARCFAHSQRHHAHKRVSASECVRVTLGQQAGSQTLGCEVRRRTGVGSGGCCSGIHGPRAALGYISKQARVLGPSTLRRSHTGFC